MSELLTDDPVVNDGAITIYDPENQEHLKKIGGQLIIDCDP